MAVEAGFYLASGGASISRDHIAVITVLTCNDSLVTTNRGTHSSSKIRVPDAVEARLHLAGLRAAITVSSVAVVALFTLNDKFITADWGAFGATSFSDAVETGFLLACRGASIH